jgi:CRP-like cAMP-binding protein
VRAHGQDVEYMIPSRVRLFEAEPELLVGIDARAARWLSRNTTVEAVDIEHGAALPRRLYESGAAGAMVLYGVLAGSAWVGKHRSVELLGAGDVISLSRGGAATGSWRSLNRARVMILDEDFLEATHQYPGILAVLLERAAARADRLSRRLAIVSIRHLDDRLLVLLHDLADLWGVEEPGAVRIPLRLSHELLADMAGAQRPSVSAAVARLRSRGLVARGPHGSWLLLTQRPEPVSTMTNGLAFQSAH